MVFPTLILCLSSIVAASTSYTNVSIPRVKITVDAQIHHQEIDGFGISQAFQRARQVQRLVPTEQQKALDLLFSTETGAGLTILRNGIGSSSNYSRDWMKSIAPRGPASANGTLQYEWDGDDAGQVWLTKEALKRAGTELTVYADAWSTPGYMKTNGEDSNGGSICGVREADCASGDWRKAYAEYLIQLLRFYKEKENITISHLGFLNEPDLNQTYASMQSSGFQAADMLKVLRPTLDASEYKDVKVVCCEATGWGDGEDILGELQSVPGADSTIDVYSAHGYSVNPALPYKTKAKVWQTEWADLDGKWNTAWDNLGKEGEGISWANKIHQALTLSNVSGFLYWIGAEFGNVNSALIRIENGTVIPSKRLWAFAQYSRFVRPGAVRVEARSDAGYVRVSAFLNGDGKVAVQVL
jgi:O-glycosyl hydrolase